LGGYGVAGEREIPGRGRSRAIAGASATIEGSNGKRGLINFVFMGPREGPEVEGEKKTNAHHV
jgi:hypothetical protein